MTGIAGVDDVSDVPLPQSIGNFAAALADLSQHVCAYSVGFQELCSAGCGFDIEAQIVETANEGQSLFLVPVGDGYQNRAIILQMHAGGLQSLVKCPGHGVVVSDGFAGRLHFRGQIGIQSADLIEGEDRCFDVPTLFFVGINVEDTKFFQTLAQNHLSGNIRQAVTGGFTEEGDGTGGTGIDFDDIHVVILVHDKLDVVKTDDANTQTQFLGVLQDRTLDLVGDGEGGIDRDGVAGVDAGAFYQFHNAGNKHIPSVTDGIHFHFPTFDILIHKHRFVFVDLNGRF